MADKHKTNLVLPGDTDNSFEDDHFLLTYRPKIDFVEPEQEQYTAKYNDEVETIDNFRDTTKDLIDKLDSINKLCDLAQERIDNRVKSNGGVTINLDPKKDAIVIASMKRMFPDKEDPTKITYDDYKKALDCMNQNALVVPQINSEDIKAATSDPLRTDFGGYSNQNGENRAELSSIANSIEPLDLEIFQKSAVMALFAMMLPLIKAEDKQEIIQHMIETPHY